MEDKVGICHARRGCNLCGGAEDTLEHCDWSRPVVRRAAYECIVGAREFETEATADYASDAQCFWCRGIIPAAWVRDAIETEMGVCASRVPIWC